MEELLFWEFLLSCVEPPLEERHRLLLEYASHKGSGSPISLLSLVQEYQWLSEAQWREWKNFWNERKRTVPASEAKVLASDELPFQEFGPYRIERLLGQGGMALVFLAEHKISHRKVALKILRTDWTQEEQLERFQREIEAIAKLKHPNIVELYDAGEHNGLPYYTMEYISGSSLEELLQRGQVDLQRGLEILEAVARALAYSHSLGIIHRDIKPSNILICEDGTPKLTDFSLAKVQDAPSLLTRTGEIVGTVSYMSPEVASGRIREVDGRSDIFSLGVILYQIATGGLPFTGRTTMEVLENIRTSFPVFPPEVPRKLQRLILKALEKSPRDRYQTATQLADDLRRYLEGEPLSFDREHWLWLKNVWKQHKNTILVSATVTTLLLLLLWEFLYFQAKLTQMRRTMAVLRQERAQKVLEGKLEALLLLKRTRQALRELEQAKALFQGGVSFYQWRGRILLEMRKYHQAISDFQKVLQATGDSPEVLFGMAKALYFLGRHSSSLAYLKRAQQCGKKGFYLPYYQALNLYALRKYRLAEQKVQKALALSPPERRDGLYLLYGKILYWRKQYVRAFSILQKIQQNLGEKPLFLARIYARFGQTAKSLQLYRKAFLSRSPLAPLVIKEWGELLVKLERWQEAVQVFQKWRGKKIAAPVAEPWSKALLHLGELHKSCQVLEQATGLSRQAKIRLALLLFWRGETNKAFTVLQETREWSLLWQLRLISQSTSPSFVSSIETHLKHHPKDFLAYGFRGVLQWYRGRPTEAWEELKKVLTSTDRVTLPFVWNYGGLTLLALGKKEEARKLFAHASELHLLWNQPWMPYYRQGLAWERKGQYKRAQSLYQFVLTWNPVFPQAHFREAVCRQKLGDTKGALRAFHRCITYAPFFWPAYEVLLEELLLQRNWTKAERILERARQFLPEQPRLIFLSGKLAWLQGKHQKARQLLEKAKRLGYLSPEVDVLLRPQKSQNITSVHLTKWKRLVAKGRYKQALRWLRQKAPQFPQLWYVGGKVWLKWAKSQLRQSPHQVTSPSSLPYLIGAGLFWAEGSFYHSECLEALFSEEFLLQWRLATSSLDFAHLWEHVEEQASSTPPWAKAFFHSYTLFLRGRAHLKQARKTLLSISSAGSSSAAFWTLLALIELERGAAREAKLAARRALRLWPESALAFYVLAGCDALACKTSSAAQFLHTALDQGLPLPREWILSNPIFKPLHVTREWRVLVRRLR